MHPSRPLKSRFLNKIYANLKALGVEQEEFEECDSLRKKIKLSCDDTSFCRTGAYELSEVKGMSSQVLKKVQHQQWNELNLFYGTAERLVSLRNLVNNCRTYPQEEPQKNLHDLEHQEKVLKEAEEYAIENKFNFASCVDLLALPDDSFESILRRRGDLMDIATVTNFITFTWTRNKEGQVETSKNRKYGALAELLVLPKLMDTSITLRSIFPCYEKLASIDKEIVLNKILLPLIQNGKIVQKSLCTDMNMDDLLRKTLQWIVEKSVMLNDQLLHTLTFSMVSSEFPISPTGDLLLTAIERTLCTKPKDKALGSFMYSLFTKYESSMSPAQIKRSLEINILSETMFKELIKNILEKQIKHR